MLNFLPPRPGPIIEERTNRSRRNASIQAAESAARGQVHGAKELPPSPPTRPVQRQRCPDPTAGELLEPGLGWPVEPPDKGSTPFHCRMAIPQLRDRCPKDLSRSFLQGTFNSLSGKATQGVGVCMGEGVQLSPFLYKVQGL